MGIQVRILDIIDKFEDCGESNPVALWYEVSVVVNPADGCHEVCQQIRFDLSLIACDLSEPPQYVDC